MKQIYDRKFFDAVWEKVFMDTHIPPALAERLLREKNNKLPSFMSMCTKKYNENNELEKLYIYVCGIEDGMMLKWKWNSPEDVYCNQPWKEGKDLYAFIVSLSEEMNEYYQEEIASYSSMLRE